MVLKRKEKNPGLGTGPERRALETEEPPARWRRRKEDRPQEILEAALKVFAEKGFAAARLEEIATKAGVSKGTIYLYFESKEAMFKALIQERLGARVNEIGDIVRDHSGPVAPLLEQILRTIGMFVRTGDYAVLPKIVIAEAGNFPDLARIYREAIIDRGTALLGQVIGAGMARGEFRKFPVEHAVRLALAPLLLIAIWRTTFSQFDATPYDYDGLIDAHIATLLKGLAQEDPA